MAKASEHGDIIAAAAKAALAPLGCFRRGHSRTWQDDHRYWAVEVEFQPSGWSKGSYLNIHVAWLWAVTLGYQFSYRAGSFVPFENAEQFTPLIAKLAATAAVEVQNVRERFSSFTKIHDHIIMEDHRAAWPGYNAGVACGLAGNIAAAVQYFDRVAAWDPSGRPWALTVKENATTLVTLLDRPPDFRKAVVVNIAQRRQLMRLPPDAHCLDELDSIARP